MTAKQVSRAQLLSCRCLPLEHQARVIALGSRPCSLTGAVSDLDKINQQGTHSDRPMQPWAYHCQNPWRRRVGCSAPAQLCRRLSCRPHVWLHPLPVMAAAAFLPAIHGERDTSCRQGCTPVSRDVMVK